MVKPYLCRGKTIWYLSIGKNGTVNSSKTFLNEWSANKLEYISLKEKSKQQTFNYYFRNTQNSNVFHKSKQKHTCLSWLCICYGIKSKPLSKYWQGITRSHLNYRFSLVFLQWPHSHYNLISLMTTCPIIYTPATYATLSNYFQFPNVFTHPPI